MLEAISECYCMLNHPLKVCFGIYIGEQGTVNNGEPYLKDKITDYRESVFYDLATFYPFRMCTAKFIYIRIISHVNPHPLLSKFTRRRITLHQ